MKVAVKATLVVLAAVLVVMLIGVFFFGWFARLTAGFRGETAQIENVQADPNYRIAAYDHFFDLCASVQSTEATIAAQRAELDTGPSPERAAQINANITAATSSRARLINQYNADASKTDTQANFLASNLPYRLDIKEKETQCTVN